MDPHPVPSARVYLDINLVKIGGERGAMKAQEVYKSYIDCFEILPEESVLYAFVEAGLGQRLSSKSKYKGYLDYYDEFKERCPSEKGQKDDWYRRVRLNQHWHLFGSYFNYHPPGKKILDGNKEMPASIKNTELWIWLYEVKGLLYSSDEERKAMRDYFKKGGAAAGFWKEFDLKRDWGILENKIRASGESS